LIVNPDRMAPMNYIHGPRGQQGPRFRREKYGCERQKRCTALYRFEFCLSSCVGNPIPLCTERLRNAPNTSPLHSTCKELYSSHRGASDTFPSHQDSVRVFPIILDHHTILSHFTFSPFTFSSSHLRGAGHEASLFVFISNSLLRHSFVSSLSPPVYATALYVFQPACTFLVGCQNPPVLTRTTRSERYRVQSRVILEQSSSHRDHHFSPSNSQSHRVAARQASIILTAGRRDTVALSTAVQLCPE
jgi:hypothetical protein